MYRYCFSYGVGSDLDVWRSNALKNLLREPGKHMYLYEAEIWHRINPTTKRVEIYNLQTPGSRAQP